MRVAGIDCGTNSIRLLIADAVAESDGFKLNEVLRRMEVVRLGYRVDETGEFDVDALARTLAMVKEYARICQELAVESLRFVATSASRDARNKDLFIDGVEQILGVKPEVISGRIEAQTSFSGAISALSGKDSGYRKVLAIDLGGGSTELALGTANQGLLAGYSMDIGCVRIFERRLKEVQEATNPEFTPEADKWETQINLAVSDISAALDEAEHEVPLTDVEQIIGLAGSVTTIAATGLNLAQYDAKKIHGSEFTISEMVEICDWYLQSSSLQRAKLGFMHPGRVDVITAGALVWREVIQRISLRCREAGVKEPRILVSENDILDGIALWAAREPQFIS
ncbi:MAG: exopolyphosphatase [Arcanobacterium sp.]|nr:exopolyphosphatase [Arcanobacterium sp.]